MFSPLIHRYLFLAGLCFLGGDMALGEVPTSMPQGLLVLNWLLEGRFKEKLQNVWRNKYFWALSSVLLLHVLGLIHTHDLNYGIDDIFRKLPLLLLPLLFFSAEPLTVKELKMVLHCFMAGVLIASFWCLGYYSLHPDIDPRDASRFISHIRYGLMINMAIATAAWLMREEEKRPRRIVYAIIALYLIFFMFALSLVTGLVLLGLLVLFRLVINILEQPVKVKIISFGVLVTLISSLLLIVKEEWRSFSFIDTSAANQPLVRSASGRPYDRVENQLHTENGFFVSYNIQRSELIQQWYQRTHSEIQRKDKNGNSIIATAIRYLSSKGLTKDSAGIAALSEEDIANIQNGVTNYKYVNASALTLRLNQLFWEYKDYRAGSNPSGNTMLMRFEFWKAAVYIIERNLWFGVGTGDPRRAFAKAYTRTNSSLAHEWRLRSHNQFLAITVAFGVTGLLVFLFFLIYPIVKLRKYLHPLYFVFYIIAVVSFLTEDTLETQAGVTFFAYFNTLFIWLAKSPFDSAQDGFVAADRSAMK